jgi:hypothetical protein
MEMSKNKPLIKLTDLPFKYQPSCEQEVVIAFGLIAKKLGFEIKEVGTSFPDCKARLRGKNVKIEFEYQSSNFHHPVGGCDYIVCWEDNALRQKPKVIPLKSLFPSSLRKRTKGSSINVSDIVLQRALNDPGGIPYPGLKQLLGKFSKRNPNEPVRCLARLFFWGCSPYADKGHLKVHREKQFNTDQYAIQENELFMELGKDLRKLLEVQWKEQEKDAYKR